MEEGGSHSQKGDLGMRHTSSLSLEEADEVEELLRDHPPTGDASFVLAVNNRKLPEFTIAQKIMILDRYHETVKRGVKHPKSDVVKWTKSEFHRPSFSRQALSAWINNETGIRNARGKKEHAKKVSRGSSG